MRFKDNVLLYTFIPLIVLMVGASYMRFIVLQDYLVAYEGECDPAGQSCYVGCEDDECAENYYYSIIIRPATEIRALCGVDISSCEAAQACPVGEPRCTVTYCDPDIKFQSCDEINARAL